MTKEQILNYFYTNSTNLGVLSILLVLLGGLLVGAIIYFTYYVNYRGVSYNRKFNLSLIVMLEISVVIMLMISSNIVISLGMVGALSIVRFRTAIKDSRDTVFIFWAIAEGLSVGSQNFKLAFIAAIFISIIMIAFEFIPKLSNKYLVIVRGSRNIRIDDITNKFKSYTNNYRIRTASNSNDRMEVIFEVKTKGEISNRFIEGIAKIEGIENVNYILENGEDVG